MPQPLQIEDGPADELVQLNIRVPRWMKNEGIRVVGELGGKSLNDFVRDALREALDRARSKAGGISARGRGRGRAPARR